MTKTERKHTEQIEKRILCLKRRIEAETTGETPAQKSELAALEWALTFLPDNSDVCCLSDDGDSDELTYRMLFGHFPDCPKLARIYGIKSKAGFQKGLDALYKFWKVTEADKIENEFYAQLKKL